MTVELSRHASWLEAISLFEQLRNGDHMLAEQLIKTSEHSESVVDDLLRMLVVFLRGEESQKIDRFIDAAHRSGPPPAPPTFAGDV